jgi:bifunctional DNA-binding transcriptional regulator/antitoxin component of YhaV-PrlF toxin-antitoxin module
MTMLTITAKGQVTLKQQLLRHLGVAPGDRIEIDELPGGRVIVRAAQQGDISDFIGCLASKKSRKATIDEMNEAISRGWAGGK